MTQLMAKPRTKFDAWADRLRQSPRDMTAALNEALVHPIDREKLPGLPKAMKTRVTQHNKAVASIREEWAALAQRRAALPDLLDSDTADTVVEAGRSVRGDEWALLVRLQGFARERGELFADLLDWTREARAKAREAADEARAAEVARLVEGGYTLETVRARPEWLADRSEAVRPHNEKLALLKASLSRLNEMRGANANRLPEIIRDRRERLLQAMLGAL